MEKKNFIIKFIVLLSTIILIIITYFASLPGIPKLTSTNFKTNTIRDYFNMVYNTQNNTITPDLDKINFLWDNLPPDLDKKFPTAYNLSFKWPPPKGSKYRLTAFPYPKGGGQWWIINVIKGIASLLNNTKDQVTFPGWMISVYDPKNPNENVHAKWLTEQFPWKPITTSMPSNSDGVYMEVLHACYAPPNTTYPLCDDGGYWLYLAAGNGVFWNSGTRVLVANNKIDAMLKLLDSPIIKKKTKFWNYYNIHPKDSDAAIQFMVKSLEGTGGGKSLIGALSKVVTEMQKEKSHGKQKILLTAFRTMEQSNAGGGWALWLTFLILIMVGIVSFFVHLIQLIKNKKKSKRYKILVIFAELLGLVVSVFFFWWIITDIMLVDFGYMTLDIALSRSKLSLKDFIQQAATGNNMIANGLAMVQNFDLDLAFLSDQLELDSFILHAQPNKSGSWSVEICDLRNTPCTLTNVSGKPECKDIVSKLGLCGMPLKGANSSCKNNATKPPCSTTPGNCMPAMLQGPIVKNSKKYIGYQPTKCCNCDENMVQQEYNKTKKLKTCLFCSGQLSDKLCTPSLVG